MSNAETKRFFGDMGGNAELKSGADASGNVKDLAAYAQGKGYDVTAEDLTSLAAQNKELSEEQLEAVAGGFEVNMGVSVGCVVCVSFS